MKIVVFGLSISSAWGNGHATVWRSLAAGLAREGHRLIYFERNVPYYAEHRDFHSIDNGTLHIYETWAQAASKARRHLRDADVGMVTSYCPDANAATELLFEVSGPMRVFYDLDTPVTLARLNAGDPVPWLGRHGLAPFDLVLSFTGGESLEWVRRRLGARRVFPLYGSVDPSRHRPVAAHPSLRADVSYLGTYAADRQDRLERLLIRAADALPDKSFLLAGPLYPPGFPWRSNIRYRPHVSPPLHSAFYCSSPLTLNLTRQPMAASGFCPSGRLFEAAACGVPVVSDRWPGVEHFFEPGREILLASSTEEAVAHMQQPLRRLAAVGRAARRRALAEHTGRSRARELLHLLQTKASAPTAADAGGQPGVAP